jgi:hypothetical protein
MIGFAVAQVRGSSRILVCSGERLPPRQHPRHRPALLLDLARKPVFLHDNTVPTLESLDGQDRTDMIELMRSFSAD